MTTIDNNEVIKLLEGARDALIYSCEQGWDRLTDRVIIPHGTYTYEETLRRGCSWSYGEIEKIDAFLEKLTGEKTFFSCETGEKNAKNDRPRNV
jgi:hypothetical protein